MGHDRATGLFPALLKYWRRQRGLSQLDLAVAADVSARHVSFLETGRSVPSAAMVRQLARTLGLPLRHLNEMLRSAGHAEDDGGELVLPESVRHAIELLKMHHEPFPLLVVDRIYCVQDANRAATTLLRALAAPAPGDAEGDRDLRPNLARMAFDPAGAQPHLVNFAEIGREILWRIQRELLADPDDAELRELLDELLAMPTVVASSRTNSARRRPSSPNSRPSSTTASPSGAATSATTRSTSIACSGCATTSPAARTTWRPSARNSA